MRKSVVRYLFVVAIAIVAMAACGGRGANRASIDAAQNQDVAASRSEIFRPTLPSDMIPDEQKAQYAQEHFWDEFRFEDSTYIAHQDTVAMLQCFAFYVAQVIDPADSEPLSALMRQAAERKHTLQYFMYLAEEVLHDPNSPLRNDELYIPVLEVVVASPLLDKYEKMASEYDLRMAQRNRIGHQANDFVYTLLSGRKGSLHGIEADYVVIFFSNPGCPMCGEIEQDMTMSPLLDKMVGEGSVAVLMLYPDEDVEAWREHAASVPDEWIYARDEGCIINSKSLYDLKAIPSLYLLDRQHRVLVKDASRVAELESALAFYVSRGV